MRGKFQYSFVSIAMGSEKLHFLLVALNKIDVFPFTKTPDPVFQGKRVNNNCICIGWLTRTHSDSTTNKREHMWFMNICRGFPWLGGSMYLETSSCAALIAKQKLHTRKNCLFWLLLRFVYLFRQEQCAPSSFIMQQRGAFSDSTSPPQHRQTRQWMWGRKYEPLHQIDFREPLR